MVLEATFSNISAISWRSVLLVDQTKVPEENHRPAQVTDKQYYMVHELLIFTVNYIGHTFALYVYYSASPPSQKRFLQPKLELILTF